MGGEQPHDWAYHGSISGSGSVTITPERPGLYYVMMLCCDGYTELSESVAVQVHAPAVDAYGNSVPATCATWFDGCNQCAVGNSTADSCRWQFDGECDEPWLCDAGTDSSDCALHPAGGWTPGGWMDGGW